MVARQAEALARLKSPDATYAYSAFLQARVKSLDEADAYSSFEKAAKSVLPPPDSVMKAKHMVAIEIRLLARV
ncbi:hypothetical protein EJB05_01571, partial [Eragrostis curvula]